MRPENRRSFPVDTGPGTPMWIGSSTPRSRTRRIHGPMTSGEKQIWPTMYVASGANERARALPDVAGDDEHLAHAELVEPRQQLAQVGVVDHQAGREVRHDALAVSGEPLAD